MSCLPKYNLIYFKNLLDAAVISFFEEYGNSFVKIDDNWQISKQLSLQQIEDFLIGHIDAQISSFIQEFDIIKSPNYYIVIGACQPKDNYLLKFKNGYFPKKLDELISRKFSIKYFLKEKDIKIDIIQFNEACCNAFNAFFSEKKKYPENCIFLTHKNLDCYSLFKTVKCIFGKSNCINLKEQMLNNIRSPLIAVNDMIDRYVHDKCRLNSDKDFKIMYKEIEQFLQLKTSKQV